MFVRALLIAEGPGSTQWLSRTLAEVSEPGVELRQVESVEEGLDAMRSEAADVILLDVTFSAEPARDVQRLVAADVPVIALTTKSRADAGQLAVEAGAADCLVKGSFCGDLFVRALRFAVERHRLTAELRTAAIRQANELKEQFVATVSHELRTPLHVIIGYTDLLRNAVLGEINPKQEEALAAVEKNSKNLLDLIETTLDLNCLHQGEINLRLQNVSPAEIIEQLREDMGPACEQSGLEVSWRVADDVVEVHTDPVKLRVILKHLVGNALKFTPKGSVDIGVRAADDGVEFAVGDTGIGIDPAQRQAIFEPFRQGETYMTRRHGGIGIGLYVARRLVDALGGRVELESTLGQGSSFRVWIPRELGAAASAPTPSADSSSEADDWRDANAA